MDRLLHVPKVQTNEIISAVLDQAAPCVISCRTEGGWTTFKSYFVRGGQEQSRIMIERPDFSVAPEIHQFQRGEALGVSFRRGHKKCMFSSVVLDIPGNGSQNVPVIEIRWPSTIHQLQRRVFFRAKPPGRPVRVRFWEGGVAARAGQSRDEVRVLNGTMLDLSAGGVRIRTTDVALETFGVGAPVGCAFTPKPRGETLVMDAVFRHWQPEADGTASIGLQFVGLEATERGREMLSQLAGVVSDYQREQSRGLHAHLAHRSI